MHLGQYYKQIFIKQVKGNTPPVLRVGTITIIGAAEIAAWRARMQALFGERK